MHVPWPVRCYVSINYSKQPGQNQINRNALSKNSFNCGAPRINYVSWPPLQWELERWRGGALQSSTAGAGQPHSNDPCVYALESVNGGQQWGEIVCVRITKASVQIKRCACHARAKSVKLLTTRDFIFALVHTFFSQIGVVADYAQGISCCQTNDICLKGRRWE